jgi:hypothetical protein
MGSPAILFLGYYDIEGKEWNVNLGIITSGLIQAFGHPFEQK